MKAVISYSLFKKKIHCFSIALIVNCQFVRLSILLYLDNLLPDVLRVLFLHHAINCFIQLPLAIQGIEKSCLFHLVVKTKEVKHAKDGDKNLDCQKDYIEVIKRIFEPHVDTEDDSQENPRWFQALITSGFECYRQRSSYYHHHGVDGEQIQGVQEILGLLRHEGGDKKDKDHCQLDTLVASGDCQDDVVNFPTVKDTGEGQDEAVILHKVEQDQNNCSQPGSRVNWAEKSNRFGDYAKTAFAKWIGIDPGQFLPCPHVHFTQNCLWSHKFVIRVNGYGFGIPSLWPSNDFCLQISWFKVIIPGSSKFFGANCSHASLSFHLPFPTKFFFSHLKAKKLTKMVVYKEKKGKVFSRSATSGCLWRRFPPKPAANLLFSLGQSAFDVYYRIGEVQGKYLFFSRLKKDVANFTGWLVKREAPFWRKYLVKG